MSERQELDPYVFGREQRCFGCGPHNDVGLRLRFVREGDEVVTSWTPRPGYEGPPSVMHGGLQATLADEVAGWALVGLLGRMGFTTSLDVRFVRPVRIDREVQARAKVASRSGSIVTLHVTLRQDGKTTVLKPKVTIKAGEVIDATFMSRKALREFLEAQIEDAKKQGILFSVHLKATMMKVSDPKIFGHVVSVFFKEVFEKYKDTFQKLGVDPDNGLGDLYAKITDVVATVLDRWRLQHTYQLPKG